MDKNIRRRFDLSNTENMTTYTKIYENLRRFEVEMVFSADGCLASITENGANVWSIYAHTEKSLKAKVTSWIKANW